MNRQSETIREITFAEQDSLILVPPKMLEQVISCCQKGPTSCFVLDEFYPPDLMKYLRQVLETNRHLPLFSPGTLHSPSDTSRRFPDCTCEGIPGMDEIFMLAIIQLGSLQIDQRSCLVKLSSLPAPRISVRKRSLRSFATASHCRRCRLTSNMSTAAATAAFSDSAFPCMGIRIRPSAHSATSSLNPFPSFPMRNAVPPE